MARRFYIRLYELFIEPKRLDEEERRKEFMLNMILSASIVLLACLGGHISFWFFSFLLGLLLSLLVISRKGYVNGASHLLISAGLLITIYGTRNGDVGLPAGLLGYAIIIMMSSILIDRRTAICLALIATSSLLIPGIKESRQGQIPIRDIVEYSALLGFITALLLLFQTEIRKSLKKTRKSYAERVSELYHFAEFGKISGGLFHDLINPLFSVSLNLEQVRSSLHPELSEIKENLERSLRASKKMDKFITAARRQLRVDDLKETFSLNEIIEDAILLVNYKAMKAGVTIKFQTDEHVFTYNIPVKFQQIITNLLCNAVDAYEGIDAGFERDKSITILMDSDGKNLRLSVTDNGKGIDPEIRGRIFEPFFSTKRSHKGMGLGLSNTKAIVEKDFSGTIMLEESRNHGACFMIRFPITYST